MLGHQARRNALKALMQRLGHSKWVAQGGDWGAGVTTVLGHMKPAGLAGIHLNRPHKRLD
jgi:pimeloyl-ACP methyl ester carboxylesterase